MEKINFNQVRGFSDSITLTFNFIITSSIKNHEG